MKFQKIKGPQNHHLFKPFNDKGEVMDVFWIRYFKAGKGRLEESLKTNILTDARIIRDRRIAEFLGERPRFIGKGILVEEKFPEFLETKRAMSAGTYDIFSYIWTNHINPSFGHLLVSDIDDTRWMLHVIEHRKTSPNFKFKNTRMVLKNFLRWLHDAGLISRVPKLEMVDPEINAGEIYTPEELTSLINSATEAVELRIRMGVEMLMRRDEIRTLEWSQVDFQNGLIHLPAEKTKIRSARTFAISPKVSKLLKKRSLNKNGPWVFPSPRNPQEVVSRSQFHYEFKEAQDVAGVEGRFHDLRHTGLTNAFKQSINPALICEYAGLSLQEAQKTYLHFSPEDTRAVASFMRIKA